MAVANLRTKGDMEAEFKKICPEKWFTDVVDGVTSEFAGKSANAEIVKNIIMHVLKNLGPKIPKDHAFGQRRGVVFELVDALTGDAGLAASAKICVADALVPG